jgi:hypothetical protein
MVGIEYNWLISTSRAPDGSPQIRMSGGGLVTVLVAIFCVCAVALRAESSPSASTSDVAPLSASVTLIHR